MRLFLFVFIVAVIIAAVIGFVMSNRPQKSRKLTRAEAKELLALRALRDEIENEVRHVPDDPFADLIKIHISESYRRQRQELE